ncbi:glutathione S-transferase family protein [Marivita hallyeonensis]|uniref:glutathione transferase n=1 Tax=Marivita hallyeonensis TaxID=996342 RepID=A0A1M5RKI2_9RHOB|nr:glutathione S-transferase family protein [Marivita hallyeonensis]SHH26588.1 glutathione S-transferase [Marivita hallyeonensis]
MTVLRPTLIGYAPSVYTRAVRMAAAHHRVAYDWEAWNPFDTPDGPHPFGRVPVWKDGDFTLYETAAILTYLDAFAGHQIHESRVAARVQQVASIADSYAYWPLVRQVYAHAVFRPSEGEVGDASQIAQGMAAAPRVLAALDAIAAEGAVLNGTAWTRADWHLAPMIAGFVAYAPAQDFLQDYAALARWFGALSETQAFVQTTEAMA